MRTKATSMGSPKVCHFPAVMVFFQVMAEQRILEKTVMDFSQFRLSLYRRRREHLPAQIKRTCSHTVLGQCTVLSVQITVAEPNASTEGMCRIRALRLAMPVSP